MMDTSRKKCTGKEPEHAEHNENRCVVAGEREIALEHERKRVHHAIPEGYWLSQHG
jgi:hypothetical protein